MCGVEDRIKDLENTCPPSLGGDSYPKSELEHCETEPDFIPDVRATPLFEVFGVSIHCSNASVYKKGSIFEVYGVVSVTDEEGTTFDVYNRQKDHPELIPLGGSLSISGRHCGVISLSTTLKVKVDLRDRAQDLVIAEGLFYMSYRTTDDFDQLRVEHVHGEQCCFAAVRCITFEHALVATVGICCQKKDDRFDRAANIYGSIIASYGDNYRCSIRDNVSFNGGANSVCFDGKKVSDVHKEYTSCVLFHKSIDQAARVKFETHIPLNRRVVAVPAFTSLVIEVNLFECDGDAYSPFVSGVLEFYGDMFPTERVSGPKGVIEVFVAWPSAYIQLALLTDLLLKPTGLIDVSKFDEQRKMLQFLSYLQSPLAAKVGWESKRLGSPLVEVFSISVHPFQGEIRNLYGSITISDLLGDYYMFNRDDKSPAKALSIVWPPCSIVAPEFEMIFDLKDDKGQIIYGYLTWSFYSISIPLSWYHKRLCSIIRGRYVYAAVHYVLLTDAFQGTLKISLCGNNSSGICPNIWGKVCAYYNDYKYSTCYERENYQSVLFDQREEDSLRLTCGSELPLSRYALSVPTDSYLIIEAELWATSSRTEVPEPVRGIAKVKGERNGKFKEVIPQNCGAQNYHLEVYVECSYVNY